MQPDRVMTMEDNSEANASEFLENPKEMCGN